MSDCHIDQDDSHRETLLHTITPCIHLKKKQLSLLSRQSDDNGMLVNLSPPLYQKMDEFWRVACPICSLYLAPRVCQLDPQIPCCCIFLHLFWLHSRFYTGWLIHHYARNNILFLLPLLCTKAHTCIVDKPVKLAVCFRSGERKIHVTRGIKYADTPNSLYTSEAIFPIHEDSHCLCTQDPCLSRGINMYAAWRPIWTPGRIILALVTMQGLNNSPSLRYQEIKSHHYIALLYLVFPAGIILRYLAAELGLLCQWKDAVLNVEKWIFPWAMS